MRVEIVQTSLDSVLSLQPFGGSWELEGEVDCDDSMQTCECQWSFA